MSNIDHPSSINRDYIRLLQVMRRFVKEEFACDIRMSQEDALDQLLHFADRSRNHVLQEMGKELREFVQQLPEVTTEEEHDGSGRKVRYYRGAAIAVEEDDDGLPEASAPVEKKPQPGNAKRVYRGQIIDS